MRLSDIFEEKESYGDDDREDQQDLDPGDIWDTDDDDAEDKDGYDIFKETKSRIIKLSELGVSLFDEESQASQQAKQMGLQYKGFGRWADPRTGTITHKSDGDRLISVGPPKGMQGAVPTKKDQKPQTGNQQTSNLPGVGEVPRDQVGKLDGAGDGFSSDRVSLTVPGKGKQRWSMKSQSDADAVINTAAKYGLKYLWPKGLTKNAQARLQKSVMKAQRKGTDITYIDPESPEPKSSNTNGG